MAMCRPIIIGHDGCENAAPASLDSVIRAIESGADFAEVDARATKDGVAVLQHDVGVPLRDGGELLISESSFDELAGAEAAGLLDFPTPASRLTQLGDVLDYVDSVGLSLNIDIKDLASVEAVVNTIRSREVQHRHIVSGCDPQMASRVRALCPDMAVLLDLKGDLLPPATEESVSYEQLHEIFSTVKRIGCVGVNVEYPYCSEAFFSYFRYRFVPVAVWTVDDIPQMEAFLGLGPYSITTHNVTQLVELRNEIHSPFKREA